MLQNRDIENHKTINMGVFAAAYVRIIRLSQTLFGSANTGVKIPPKIRSKAKSEVNLHQSKWNSCCLRAKIWYETSIVGTGQSHSFQFAMSLAVNETEIKLKCAP
jgi:hypothetical protein